METTIAAIATPVGPGGLGVIRVSGPGTLPLADQIFRSRLPLSTAASHTLHHGFLHGEQGVVDEAVAGVFRAPRSYTGEDVVEFSCHGGPVILQRVLSLCTNHGARLADPGEFTRRAFLNGKMDLSQAEAVAELIAARSDAQGRLALERLRGGLSRRLAPIREGVLDLLARVEANLDFEEDDVPALSRKALESRLEMLSEMLSSLLRKAGPTRLWRDGLRVTILGRPNVGKSSLFNALLNSDRAIVTDRPGTTRDTLEETVVWEGVPVSLMDTAGLREADDAVEREGVARARRAAEATDLAVLVVERGAKPSVQDQETARAAGDRPMILALNKADLPFPGGDPGALWEEALGLNPGTTVSVSARTGEGLPALRRAVLRLAGGGPEPTEPESSLNTRQETLLAETQEFLTSAGAGGPSAPPETTAIDLRHALDRLNRVTGEGAPEEVLSAIFSRFCVGK